MIGGLSAGTGADLAKLGFPVQDGLTWRVQNLSRTIIQYPPGHQAAARLVHRYLPGASTQPVTGLAKIRILLGASGYTVTSTSGGSSSSSSGSAGPGSPGAPSRTAAQDACQ
jgi:LytR cell envelope-related transcriptional attenuator